jgi:DNA-binding transcriptional regulator of glucitol operon
MAVSDNNGQRRQQKKVRASHVIFLAIAVAGTLALAWWQWTRFQAGSGTFQNLGYALQWPLFGLFFIFAYRKYMQYENEMIEAANNAEDPDFLYEADAKLFEDQVTEINEDFLPERPTINVDTFNELNTPRRGRRQADTDPTGDSDT